MRRRTRIFLLAALLALPHAPAHALKISPFKAELAAADPSATQVFRVENNSSESAAVQVSVLTWRIAEDGTEHNEDAENLFTVFPAQIVLKPRESKAVRVQYKGPPVTGSEAPFRVLAEQLPVRLSDSGSPGNAVRFLLRFKAALYVTPGGLASDVRMAGFEESGENLILTVENAGAAHTLLRAPVLALALKDGRTETISGAALKPVDGENLHPKSRRRFTVPLPAPLRGKVERAGLSFERGF